MEKGLSTYVGHLTPAQAAIGIQAAVRNARSLLEDAELLLKNRRWQRATALGILAIAEMGKIHILRAILLAREDKELREEWRSYRAHERKNVLWIVPELVAKGARKLDDLRPAMESTRDHGPLLESIKQIALYSGTYGKCHWCVPEDVITQDFADALVCVARLVCQTPGAFITEPELEIWVRRLSPVWKGELGKMKRALADCYAEAQSRGVLQGTYDEGKVLDFLYGGPTGLVS
jgi:AbiV family abortive infection protein